MKNWIGLRDTDCLDSSYSSKCLEFSKNTKKLHHQPSQSTTPRPSKICKTAPLNSSTETLLRQRHVATLPKLELKPGLVPLLSHPMLLTSMIPSWKNDGGPPQKGSSLRFFWQNLMENMLKPSTKLLGAHYCYILLDTASKSTWHDILESNPPFRPRYLLFQAVLHQSLNCTNMSQVAPRIQSNWSLKETQNATSLGLQLW